MELATQYNPKEAEENHYQKWEESGCFAPEINENADAPNYSIVIPPPNVTGNLHMGHALQHTIMDVLTRRKRMLGYRTLFLPGIDHAGISTQLMVTRQLKEEENKTPQEIGREAFTEKVWEWKNRFGGEITRQIRREGLSVDWSREQFTMNENLSKAVRHVFVALYEEGSIYRGARIVNWCPKDKTVLSDLEVEDKEKKDGKLYFLQYPVAEKEEGAKGRKGEGEKKKYITVATTRPETMLGDTAVAVNPDDERYKEFIGKTILLPLTGREIPIIADDYVESEFGTGAVKITPAHDPNDYEMGLRHNLPQLNVMNLDGTMNEEAGAEFDGLDRYEARKKVIEKFEELGLLEKIKDHEMVLPICERCKTVIETLISEQWWVKMDEMRDMALKLKREKDYPRFTPHNPNTKVYTDWLENLRDWTISRQLWWGHQIPAWYDENGKVFVAHSFEAAAAQAGTENLTQDEDVLDTWFSSWLWSFSTLGWNGEAVQSPLSKVQSQDDSSTLDFGQRTRDLEFFHPTNVLVTARDIIYLWVSRMVMSALKFVDERPFDDVYITGTVLDANGQRMSKTKGNGIDPLDLFDKYGVDATRMTLAGSATGADFAWRDEKVESFRNFANKIWNATRFCLMNSEGAKVKQTAFAFFAKENPKTKREETKKGKTNAEQQIEAVKQTSGNGHHKKDTGDWKAEYELIVSTSPTEMGGENVEILFWENLSIADRWIISRLNKTALSVNRALDDYQFHEAVQLLYHFFWDDFCDWYIELVKDEITAEEASERREKARSQILFILEQALRLLHPFMPFLTEELWQKLPGTNASLHHPAYKNAEPTIMLADFPVGYKDLIDEKAESEMSLIIELISKIRNIRAEMRIKTSEKLDIHIAADSATQKIFAENEPQILKLARAKELNLSETFDVPKASAKAVLTNGAEIAVPLEGLIDFEKERERLTAQIGNLTSEGDKLGKQLSNKNFVEKAPSEKVEAVRERVAEIETQVKALNQNLETLR